VSAPIAIVDAGLVTSVGLSAAASCAAIRVGITNHTETRFLTRTNEPIFGAQVPMDRPWRGRTKLAKMLRLALQECLDRGETALAAGRTPVLLCTAEADRPGRQPGLEKELHSDVEAELGIRFDSKLSRVVPHGRASLGVALSYARQLFEAYPIEHVVVAAADSMLVGATLSWLETEGRLLTPGNSNGFVPGEAAGALVLTRAGAAEAALLVAGLGLAREPAPLGSDLPLRADGLSHAIKAALLDASSEMQSLDFRITDNSGEQYYFKEAALAVTRILRVRKEAFTIWHPADCVGEVGAASGIVALAVALAACRKSYAPGPGILFHAGSDDGARAAAVLRFQGNG
jgi:3-oxoacyl-[acyl-carrier-protein] synthase-1